MSISTRLGTAALGLALVASVRRQPARRPAGSVYDQRERDWRNGAIVYQVIVDRFVPSATLEAKRGLYPPPKVLRPWSEPALPGVYLESEKLNSQELDFWGGDLASLATKVDYVQRLGVDVLYLKPHPPGLHQPQVRRAGLPADLARIRHPCRLPCPGRAGPPDGPEAGVGRRVQPHGP